MAHVHARGMRRGLPPREEAGTAAGEVPNASEAGGVMQGARMPDCTYGDEHTWPAGAYGRITHEHFGTQWYVRDPRGNWGRITTHTVEEHPDGTITVSPSLVMPYGGFHGWLRAGVWSEA